MIATREAYGKALVKLGEKYPNLVVLDAETKNSTYSEFFKEKFPKRFFEGFIAEQNMVGMAVGMSKMGKIPFLSTFAAFLTRAFDQIRMAVYSQSHINIVGSHCGVSIGTDGASQMGLEDITMMSSIFDSVVLYPSDAVSSEKLVEQMIKRKGINYLRTTREKTPVIYDENEKFEIGGFKIHKQTVNGKQSTVKKIIIFAAGITLHEALKAQAELSKQGIEVIVVDLYCVKPINKEKLLKELGLEQENCKCKECHCGQNNSKQAGDCHAFDYAQARNDIITVEDHYFDGGLGDAVLNVFADAPNVVVKKLAVNSLPHSGTPEENIKRAGIDFQSIIKTVNRTIK